MTSAAPIKGDNTTVTPSPPRQSLVVRVNNINDGAFDNENL
jgi:hypothetical protein